MRRTGPGTLGAAVDDARLRGAAAEAASWVSHGRDQAETRFSLQALRAYLVDRRNALAGPVSADLR